MPLPPRRPACPPPPPGPGPRRAGRGRRVAVAAVVAVLLAGGSTSVAALPRRPVAKPAAASTATSGWVTRSGSQLTLAGRPWRVSGVNMYWLGLDENVPDGAGPTYPSHAAVLNGFRAARSLGARLVRSITLGVSVGSPRSLEPALGHFNGGAFASIDYAVAAARHFGIRLMIPLTDQWHYYHGGKHTFTNWLGHPDIAGQNAASDADQRQQEALFYTDPSVIDAFHAYVAHLLDHVNRYTGIRLGSDPTIAIWETGNEVWDAPPAWTQQTAAFIRSEAPHALVADGSAATGKDIEDTGYQQPDVDIIDGHFYPTDRAQVVHDADVTATAGKVYLVGEYPLTGSDVPSWLRTLAGDPQIAGGLAWSMLPWLADGTAEMHQDGYTFHYPGATPAERTMDAQQLHFAKQLAAG